jgi:hypothetical protein
LLLICNLGYTQLRVNYDGSVTISKSFSAVGNFGLGETAPATKLHIKNSPNSVVRLQNGNGFFWDIGSYNTDMWSHPNSLTISDNIGYPWLIMDPVRKVTYMMNTVNIGGANFFQGDNALMGNDAQGFIFRTGETGSRFTTVSNVDGEYSGIYLGGDFAAIYSPGDGYLLKVYDEDLMKSGEQSALKWYLNSVGSAFTNSDLRKKKNINNIKSPYEKVLKLRGVTYDFIKTNAEIAKTDSIVNKLKSYDGNIAEYKKKENMQHYGLIAQELEAVVPELVETDEKGYKFINYEGIIPLLLESIKAQDSIMNNLKTEIAEIKKLLLTGNNKKSAETTLANGIKAPQLFQNTPNPFTENTTIGFYLPLTVIKANIYIYDLQGKQVKSYGLAQRETGSIVIYGSELMPGMYNYSLISDGKIIETKQMVLTD